MTHMNFAYMGPIDPKLYVHSPDLLEIGQPIWRVGQGGATKVLEPEYIGVVHLLDHSCETFGKPKFRPYNNFFVSKERLSGRKGYRYHNNSYLDSHVKPQTYNNWYLSHSEKDARAIYRELMSRWNAEYEQYRLERMKY